MSEGRSVSNFADSGLASATALTAGGRKRLRGLRLDEPEGHGFGQTGRRQNPADQLVARDARVRGRRRRGDDRKGRRELVESVVAADLLDQIDFAQEIDPERRNPDVPPVRRRGDGDPEAAQDPLDVRIGNRDTQQRGEPRAAQVKPRGLPRGGVHVDDGTHRVAAADLLHQGRETLKRDDRRADVGAALEACRGLGLEIEPLAGAADRRRLEVRAFERDAARARRDL